jgi:3-oxo-5-alpha-steroid 4-dehydrogenase 1
MITISPFLIWIWIAIGCITFLYLLKRNAPYGRHTTSGWGPTISNRLGWIIMEGWVLLVFAFWMWRAPEGLYVRLGPAGIWAAFLFSAHYIHRSFIFPLNLRTGGKRMPFIIVLSAIAFNSVNGTLIGQGLGWSEGYAFTWLADIRFWLGTLLFVTGAAINITADYYLISLRKPGEIGYKIPNHFLFRNCSAPNLGGEIIAWAGFAILCWNLAGLAFFIWTCANLIPRALAHHRWYMERFDDYPKHRRALWIV